MDQKNMQNSHIKFRKFFLSLLVVFCVKSSIGQVFLEDVTGDPLFNPLFEVGGAGTAINGVLLKFTTSEQSLGATYFKKFAAVGTTSYKYLTASVKAKPTEGYAAVFRNSQFSPGTSFNLTYNKFKLFDPSSVVANTWTDWGGVYINVNPSRYQLYRPDTTFKNQLYSKDVTGYDIGANYNLLLNGSYVIGIKGAYQRANNFSDLTELEVSDYKLYTDSVSSTIRQAGSKKTARQGTFSDYDNWTLKFAFTYLTTDNTLPENAFSLGYSIYANVNSPEIKATTTDVGLLIYAARTQKRVSTPVISLVVQCNDVSDNKKAKNGLGKRLQFGLTTTIPLYKQ